MRRLLICTVGTSLLTNRDERPWSGWKRDEPFPDVSLVEDWLASANLALASAETNTIRAIGLEADDDILLLHSDTPEGRFCSERLYSFLAKRCRAVRAQELGALGYHHASFAQRGLKNLISAATTAITEARRDGVEPVFCATGGFKAEIAFINLLGALLEVEVYYIHDQFREIIRLPRLPLAWNAEWVMENRDFFDWIDSEPRGSAEAESWLRGRPKLRPLVEDDADGNTYLNAAGNLLIAAAREILTQRPRATWPEGIARQPAEKNGLSGVPHHRPRGWDRFVQRLCSIDCVGRVAFDAAAGSGPAVKILDADAGVLGVRYGDADNSLPLRVETTARGLAQIELVAEYLRHRLK